MLTCLCGAYTTPYLQELLAHTRACPAVSPAHAAYNAQLQERADALQELEGLPAYAAPPPAARGRRIADIPREEWLAAWDASAPGSAYRRDERTGQALGISRESARLARIAYQPPAARADPETITREQWAVAWTAAGRASSIGGLWGRLERAGQALQISRQSAHLLYTKFEDYNANP